MRVDLIISMTGQERAELHALVIDARQYRYERMFDNHGSLLGTNEYRAYEIACAVETAVIEARKRAGDFPAARDTATR